MAKYQITLHNKKTFDWLDRLFSQVIAKAEVNPTHYADLAYEIEDIKQALANVKTIRESSDEDKKPKKTSTTFNHNLCPDHPTYSAKQVPSGANADCEGHWKAYKKMNPNKYGAARRKYERTKKDSGS